MIGPSSFAGHNDSINTTGFNLYNIYTSWQTQIIGKSGAIFCLHQCHAALISSFILLHVFQTNKYLGVLLLEMHVLMFNASLCHKYFIM